MLNRSVHELLTPRTAGIGASALFALVIASGCATFAPEPERPAYGGSDQIGDVSPDALVGTWRVTALNPYPDQPDQETVIEYRDDGSVIGRIDPGEEAGMGVLGEDTRFEMRGRWSVESGVVSHSDMEMEVISDNRLAQMVGGIVNSSMRDIGGTADVYELEADRIVMVGDDGAAMRYDRL